MDYFEVNFDGIVGPTHNYSGLAYGNVASLAHQYAVSNPKEAALQGLAKMKILADRGIKQAVLPPHERPHLPTLLNIGYQGKDRDIIAAAGHHDPELFYAATSAAAMWTANAATVSPSCDSADGKVHLTPANLITNFHRSLETATTKRILEAIFSDRSLFTVHAPLPACPAFADEGAANHLRFCKHQGSPGIQLFVYGREGFHHHQEAPRKFPARQTKIASQAIARLHALEPDKVLFAQQHPQAIDAGAFHNDVVSVSNETVFLLHEKAFVDQSSLLDHLQRIMEEKLKAALLPIEIKENEISLKTAVSSYLFNSQILTLPDDKVLLAAPSECHEDPAVRRVIEAIVHSPSNPIADVIYFNLRESMRNGGGPACLRLRVVLSEQELAAINHGVMLNDHLDAALKNWIAKHYRDRLEPKDLYDPQLYKEGCCALDELTQILHLGPVYEFQGYGANT